VRTGDGLDACGKVVAAEKLVDLVVALILRAIPHLQQAGSSRRRAAVAAAVGTPGQASMPPCICPMHNHNQHTKHHCMQLALAKS
jgi:hypothetical protein